MFNEVFDVFNEVVNVFNEVVDVFNEVVSSLCTRFPRYQKHMVMYNWSPCSIPMLT